MVRGALRLHHFGVKTFATEMVHNRSMAKQDDWVRLTVRIPPELHDKLQTAVTVGPNSMNAEIIARLDESFYPLRGMEDPSNRVYVTNKMIVEIADGITTRLLGDAPLDSDDEDEVKLRRRRLMGQLSELGERGALPTAEQWAAVEDRCAKAEAEVVRLRMERNDSNRNPNLIESIEAEFASILGRKVTANLMTSAQAEDMRNRSDALAKELSSLRAWLDQIRGKQTAEEVTPHPRMVSTEELPLSKDEPSTMPIRTRR